MGTKKELQLGPLSSNIQDAVYTIVNQAFDMAESTISANCEIPDGYVHIPDNASDGKMVRHKIKGDKVKIALSAALPAGLAALASVFNAPAAVVVVLSGSGGIAGSFIQSAIHGENTKLNELNLQELELNKLSVDDISIHLLVDQEKKEGLLYEAKEKIDDLCIEVANYEREMSSKHNIEEDKAFGEWVQKFLIYADSVPDDRKIQRMRDELVNRLASMKIHVYDEVVLKEDGTPDIPIQDFLIDSREGDSYSKVLKPAIYSDRSILARGEII